MKYYNNLTEILNKVKSLSPQTLVNYGVLQHSHDGLFVCPFCGNGSGEDGTGIDFKDTGDTFITHCFKCGESFNIIHVLAHHFHLDHKTQFRQVLEHSARLFNLSSLQPPTQRKVLKDYSRVIDFARTKLKTLLDKFGDGKSYRGLSFDTLRNFNVGFNPAFTYKGQSSERIIIPTSSHHFLARALDNSVSKAERKIHCGPKDIFNFDAFNSANSDDIFFLVEGEFDAMSIFQSGFNAIAVSGSEITSKSDYGTSQLNDFNSVTVKPTVIVMLDSDHKSDIAPDNIVAALQKLGYKVGKTFLPEKSFLRNHL